MGCFISKRPGTETKLAVLGQELSVKLLERCPVLQDMYYYVEGLHSNVDWGSVETINLQSNHIQLEGCYWLAVYGLKHCRNIRILELSGVGIDHRGIQYISSQGMQFCSHLTQLCLNKNDLGDEGVEVLAQKGLPHLAMLTHLWLDHNNIGVRGITSLSVNLHCCPSLLELHLSQNVLGAEGVKVLCANGLHHCQHLTTLSLGVNNIGDEGVAHLCQTGLAKVPNLAHLHLSGNNITARGLNNLGQNLPRYCPHIRELYLFFNNFGPEGALNFVQSYLRTFRNLSQLKGVTLSKYAVLLELPSDLCESDNTAILAFLRSTSGCSNNMKCTDNCLKAYGEA